MASAPVFALAESKIARARAELKRLAAYLDGYQRSNVQDMWSRTATIAYAIHGVYNGLEDVMTDIARTIDGSVPQGSTSHQALLDQMRVALDGIRPALLDDDLYARMVELKSFRHLVRHQYGIDLDPAKVEANVRLAGGVLDQFERAFSQFTRAMDAPLRGPGS